VIRRVRRDEGQASVELALVLPLVVLLLLLTVQVGVVGYRQILVVNAAREGARAAAVEPDDLSGAARRGAVRAGPLAPDRLTVLATESDGGVTVVVRYREPTDVALVGVLLPEVVLSADVTMRVER
jgi:Flp pilus assembly protein TadG